MGREWRHREGGRGVSEAVRVREGGVARAKFARGRRTLRLSARVLRGGCGPRVHGKPADLERMVGASGGGREGSRVRREGSFARARGLWL